MEEEILTIQEEAYLNGFMDASSLNARKHKPYDENDELNSEYNRGYTMSLSEYI